MSKQYETSPILSDIRNVNYEDALELAKNISVNYIKTIDKRKVFPKQSVLDGLTVFDEDLNNKPEDIMSIIEKLDKYGSKATVAQTGGRYFGFVNGGIMPSALCAKWIMDTWDQNCALYVMSPIASKLEEVCERWIVDLLRLPEKVVAGFVSGSCAATIIGLIAGRNFLLNRLGYDVENNGLFETDKLKIVVGEGAHSTIYKALSMVGLGKDRVTKVPIDNQGRMRVDQLPCIDNKTLLILQAGNVNSGAFDDFKTICKIANNAGAWVHVDGAFGLWVATHPKLCYLTEGIELADSWSVDGHKTLNAPYDNGIILCKHKEVLVNSLHMIGEYIIYNENRDGMLYTAEMSRRARAIELWATLKGLGKQGVAELVLELHDKARCFADLLEQHGLEILNDVVFNQVLVHFQNDEKTVQLIEKIQESGVCWVGGSKWFGKSVMRISVCSYKTTYEDIKVSAMDIIRVANLLK